MGKLAQSTSKYMIHAKFSADGVVEKPDVIGAVFGQTEGLLGSDMDLRDLQKTGRIGRVDVDLKSEEGKTTGMIFIPSSLDASETSLIAATLETIERIGPCNTKIEIKKIEDIRSEKRQYLIERAKELLSGTFDEGGFESDEITEQIKESVRSSEITEFAGLPAGPGVLDSDSIIVCEGRADVLRLLKNGIKNGIAIEGTSVPNAIVNISKEREVTAFLDGDRGGDLILKELVQKGVDVDFVARAPEGKEVEELTKKEIYKSLREKTSTTSSNSRKVPTKTTEPRKPTKERTQKPRTRKPRISEAVMEKISPIYKEINGTRQACMLDDKMDIIGKTKIENITSTIREVNNVKMLLIDGALDYRIATAAARAGVKTIICSSLEQRTRVSREIDLVFADELK